MMATINPNDIVLATKEDWECLLEHMRDILNRYHYVGVSDLKELVSLPTNIIDVGLGWTSLDDTVLLIRKVERGYSINLPVPQSITIEPGEIMPLTTNEALDNYKALSEWAAKAREELGSHCFIFVDEGDAGYDEINNDEVLALCHEYDELIKKEK